MLKRRQNVCCRFAKMLKSQPNRIFPFCKNVDTPPKRLAAFRKNVEMKKEGLFLSCKKGGKGNKGCLVYAEKIELKKKFIFDTP